MPRQEAQELHNFGAEPAANFRANDNQAASPSMAKLRVGVVALAPGSRIDCALSGCTSARGWAWPCRVRGETIVWHQRLTETHATAAGRWQRPRCAVRSATGTSRFMSANRTLRATRAPASRQTRATACSRGKARVDRTPEVAQAAR